MKGFAAALLAAVSIATLAATPALARDGGRSCFFANQWESWRSPAPDVILIRVNLHDIYELRLSSPAPELGYPDVHLVSRFQGSNSVCDPLDLQLEVSDNHGFRSPIIVRSMRKLTPEEVAQIPRRFRP